MTTITCLFKIILLLATIFVLIQGGAKADTKILRNISLNIAHAATRDETISLENEKDLAVKGSYVEHFFTLPSGSTLKATIDYVADKNGYRAKYTLVKDQIFIKPEPKLSPSTLKSLGR